MFIVSIKPGKKKGLILAAALLLVAVSVAAAVRLGARPPSRGMQPGSTNGERIAFLARYGWNVEAEPLEIHEVTIPLNFNDVYGEYNEIQKAQGMDLLPYAGKRCKQWVYRVTNHPQGDARAHLLIYKDQIIGGDISSPALDGFMDGFAPGAPPASSEAPAASTPGEASAGGVSGAESAPAEQAPPEESAAAAGALPVPDDAWPTD